MKKVIQAAKRWLRRSPTTSLTLRCISKTEHGIELAQLNPHAVSIVRTLSHANHEAYIVGGGIRDALCGLKPKDFDIATSAKPEQIRKLFHRALIIGRRFKLVHVFFGREMIEVATFRADHGKKHRSEHGMITRDNVYGSLQDDACRRDFTVNALYYDVHQQQILDYVDGFADLQAKILRVIGDPAERYREDPVRILRAIRFAAKTGFTIDPLALAPIPSLAPLLGHVSPSRLFEEMRKLFLTGHASQTLALLIQHDLLRWLFRTTQDYLAIPAHHSAVIACLEKTCSDTDSRIAQGKSITAAFFLACVLWYPFEQTLKQFTTFAHPRPQEISHTIREILRQQTTQTVLPAYISQFMSEIWHLQFRLARIRPRQAVNLLAQRPFRAAYDFLCLRATVAEKIKDPFHPWVKEAPQLRALADFWEMLQHAPEEERMALSKKFPGSQPKTYRRRPPKKRSTGAE